MLGQLTFAVRHRLLELCDFTLPIFNQGCSRHRRRLFTSKLEPMFLDDFLQAGDAFTFAAIAHVDSIAIIAYAT